MHPTSLAKRQLDAQNRSMAAAETLAQRAGVSMPDMRQVRQPAILQLLKWEALADVLEALANTQPAIQDTGRLLAAINTITERWGLPVEKIEGDLPIPDEVLIAFLEMMASVQPGPRISEILEIEGLSKTSVKAIMSHYHVEDSTDEE